MIAAALRVMRLRNLVRSRRTETLRRMNGWLGELPDGAMVTLRSIVGEELLARELAAIAEEVGGDGAWRVVACGAVN